jgi:hypothetical protein
MYVTPKVPERCLVCDSPYLGGHAKPGDNMKVGLRVFFKCGASMSISESKLDPPHNSFHILYKNCWCDTNVTIDKTNN